MDAEIRAKVLALPPQLFEGKAYEMWYFLAAAKNFPAWVRKLMEELAAAGEEAKAQTLVNRIRVASSLKSAVEFQEWLKREIQ